MRSLRAIVAWGVGFCLWYAPASAQCPAPDQLDGGPCCTQAQPKFPSQQVFQQAALGICWRECTIEAVTTCTADWGSLRSPAPNPSSVGPCGPETTMLRLRTGTTVKWQGKMSLLYSRTWVEVDTSGNAVQVWRYLVNGDLSPTRLAGPMPCPVPPCAPFHNNLVRFTGYVDYARTCGARTFQFAWMLTHGCDVFDHAPGFPRAGAFHPDRSYSFVGPAAGFVPAALVPTEGGGSPFDVFRRLQFVPGTTLQTCEFEDPASHTMTTLGQVCTCANPRQPAQAYFGNLTATTACGSALRTPGGPLLPAFISLGLGGWTNPNVYPGVEIVRWNTGNYDVLDPCTGAVVNEVYFGATTLQGYPAFQLTRGGVGAALPPIFIDQANSLRAPFGGPVMNEPFFSDRILSLNH